MDRQDRDALIGRLARGHLGEVGQALLAKALDFVSRLVDRAVAFLMGRRQSASESAGTGAQKVAESVVDTLVAALGQAQAELLRLRGSLTVDEVSGVFARTLAPAALPA